MKAKPLKIGNLTASIPLVQGGMGVGVSLSQLAGAVGKAGGIGVISTAQIGYLQPGFDTNPIETNLTTIPVEIKKAKEIAEGGIVAVNIMYATRFYEKYVKAAIEGGADIIFSGAGLPMELPLLVQGSDVKIAPIISSQKAASVICKYWKKKYDRLPDAIVVEGPKAGGHLGFSYEQLMQTEDTFDLEITRILEYVHSLTAEGEDTIPVIFGGGIYDRADMDYYLELGVDGVQVATRFVTTHECDASEAYKETYINAKQEDITIVKSPVGMPGRAILNTFMSNKESVKKSGKCRQCIKNCNPAEIPYCITDALIAAAKGDVENALLFCGTNAYRATKLESVADIMKEFA